MNQQAVAGNLSVAAPDHASVVATPPGKGNAADTGAFVWWTV